MPLACREPRIRITELLHEVARETGFLSAFTNVRTQQPVSDGNALLAVILADATNLGLSRMAEASHGVTRDQSFWTRDAFTPEAILTRFVMRWRIETTFQEVRAHLGVETQRQWSDRAIARTTPCLLGLFSIVTLLTGRLPARQRRSAMTAAWYPKTRPTFSDALAAVRRTIWREQHFQTSSRQTDRRKIPFRLPQAWAYALCHAA